MTKTTPTEAECAVQSYSGFGIKFRGEARFWAPNKVFDGNDDAWEYVREWRALHPMADQPKVEVVPVLMTLQTQAIRSQS